MSPRYHISPETGLPALCKAKKKPCPLGNGSSPHFSSISDANNYLEAQYNDNIDITKSVSSSDKKTNHSPTPNIMKTKIKKPVSIPKENFKGNTNKNRRKNMNNKISWVKKPFKVVKEIPSDKQKDLLKISSSTEHMKDRHNRLNKIKDTFGHGEILHAFIIDKQHKNGNEIHQINDNGCIYIFNYKTGRMITCLIARPGQIKRYFDNSPNRPSQELIDRALYNQQQGYNIW